MLSKYHKKQKKITKNSFYILCYLFPTFVKKASYLDFYQSLHD